MSEVNETPRPSGMSPLMRVVLAGALLGGCVLVFVVAPNFLRARSSGETTACKSNCKNIATGLEMYASDNKGLFPASLDRLVGGNYLKSIPTCPSAGKVTYTDYQASPNGKYFRFSCVGNNHARAYVHFNKSSDNFPAYASDKGLIDHP